MSDKTFRELSEMVQALIAEAESITAMDIDAELESMLKRSDDYTATLDAWKGRVDQLGPFESDSPWSDSQKEQFKAEVKLFQDRHLALTEKLSGARESVTQQMGDLHKRAKALRTYVDQFPSRITIAGKRKG